MKRNEAITHSLNYYDQQSTASMKDRTNRKGTDVIPVIAVIIYFSVIAAAIAFG